jgi:hypothetical protein
MFCMPSPSYVPPSIVAVAIGGSQQRFGSVALAAAKNERSDLGECRYLLLRREVTREPPWPITFDHGLNQVRTTNREVHGDHRPSARADHDGRRACHGLQERRGVSCVR